MLISNEVWGILANIFIILAVYSYIRGIYGGAVRPHLFSWIIWTLSPLLILFMQYSAGAGLWATLPLLLLFILNCFITYLAYVRRTNHMIRPIDWAFLTACLLAMPIWYIVDSPVYSAVLIAVINGVGVMPTIRKAYYFPHEESLATFIYADLRNLSIIIALTAYNITTVVFHAVSLLSMSAVILVIIIRRRYINADF